MSSSPSAQKAQRPQRTRTGQGMKAIKAPASGKGSPDEAAEVPELDLSKEVSLHSLEDAAHQSAHAEGAQAEEAKEHTKELHEDAEHGEAAAQGGAPGKPKGTMAPKGGLPQGKPQGAQQQQKAAGLVRKPMADGFEKKDLKSAAVASASFNNLAPVGSLQNKLAGTLAREQRPPDAFALLKQAQEHGVLFKEAREKDGHTEDEEDPELAAAVEECIQKCFGLRGILRIGPGEDDKAQPIIVVVAAQGFTEASFSRIPEKVHRFATLVAIPFDLLPLKRTL